MTTKPLVSIVTPSLDQGSYIEETIKSVLTQDYGNLEYLVIDGGSSDNTLDILRRYDGQIRWVSESDKGQADAVNKGIEMAKGEIIGWLNSDDVFLPGAVSKAIECFAEFPHLAMVYGKCDFVDQEGSVVGQYPTEPFNFDKLAIVNFICQPATFFKKSAFEGIGGLNSKLEYAFDLDLWIRVSQNSRVHYLPDYLSRYRLHGASKTVSPGHAAKNHAECLKVIIKHYDWAPVNRVYGYCYHQIAAKMPQLFQPNRGLTIFASLLVSVVKYLQLNRGIRFRDIRALNLENLRKLLVPWNELYQGN